MTGPRPDAADAVRAALAERAPPRDAGPLANVLTFAWRALLKIKHMPEQLFDVVVTPIMFTVLFTYMFGGALAGSPGEYLQFLLPGILVQTVVFTSIYGLSWVFIVAGLLVRTPGTMMTLSWLVLMPLTFASNIYVDPATMPGWLQAIVAANPVAVLVQAVRDIIAGAADLSGVLASLIAPALVSLVCAPVALWLYRRER
jgi:ABC-type multidrug transport system permease subunit